MTKILLITGILLYCATASAAIYKCVDSHGKITITDQACKQATTKTASRPASTKIIAVQASQFNSPKPAAYPALIANTVDLTTYPSLAERSRSQPPASTPLSERLKSTVLALIAACYLLMSFACYICYFVDKRAAQSRTWRVSERQLHTLELFGGWPGALLAQRKLRHKNRKLSYQMIFWLIVSIHISVWLDQLVLNGGTLNQLMIYISTRITA